MINVTSSGSLSASAIISVDDCYLVGFEIITDGVSDAILEIYNGVSDTSETMVLKRKISAASYLNGNTFSLPVHCKNGISTIFTGTNCNYIIYFADEEGLLQYITIFSITMEDGTLITTENDDDIVMEY